MTNKFVAMTVFLLFNNNVTKLIKLMKNERRKAAK